MLLLKITATRNGNKLRPQSCQVIGELPDDPGYWDRICDLILARMKRDGIIPLQDDHAIPSGVNKA